MTFPLFIPPFNNGKAASLSPGGSAVKNPPAMQETQETQETQDTRLRPRVGKTPREGNGDSVADPAPDASCLAVLTVSTVH